MRRRFGGRQPLCGTGVTSEMLVILSPSAFKARTADSRPGPGPLILTSRFLTPHSCAALPADSAATCAANGVDLREPLKPAPPDVAQDKALPWRSAMVMIVLLNDAWICGMPSEMFLLTFSRVRVTVLVGACSIRLVSLCPQSLIGAAVTWPPAWRWGGWPPAWRHRATTSLAAPSLVPCVCVRWCVYADREPAAPCGGARLGSSRGPSAA